jgi:hypothetical protein
MKKLLVILVASTALLGCTFVRDNQSAAKLVVEYSVAKFAEQSSSATRQQRLDNTIKVAGAVKGIVGTQVTTIPLLRELVMKQVDKLHLSPADTLLVGALVDIITEQLMAKIGDGVLKPEDKLLVSQVMDWVIEAATLSGGRG